ncbi:hypothetical protein K2173_024090 [Erythroxylum novogranatense]|uniref:Photosystem I assembly protein Ycf4 n=1 Tax=Erythroxylum novogranatense TaxID=1862640 RepID=A0AAV8UD69_9ROSI|nr:hypothetical protein K2173_024090 [Erythroxylum novogranatense]
MAYVDHACSISDKDIMMETSYSINNGPLVKEIVLAVSLFVFGLVGIILGSFMIYNQIGGDRGLFFVILGYFHFRSLFCCRKVKYLTKGSVVIGATKKEIGLAKEYIMKQLEVELGQSI